MPAPPPQSSEHVVEGANGNDVDIMRYQIASRRQALCPTGELRETWQVLLDAMCNHRPAPEHIWCLGIGPFSHPASVYQWAILQEFQDALEVGTASVLIPQTYHNRSVPLTVYDPQFESRDFALVKALGAHLPPSNEVCYPATDSVRRLCIRTSYAGLYATLPQGVVRSAIAGELGPSAATDARSLWK